GLAGAATPGAMGACGCAVRAVEIIRAHADGIAFDDPAAVEQAIGVHRRRVHVHVAEADVLGAGVDLQRRRLLLGGADDDGVAHGDDSLPLVVTSLRALLGLAGTRPDILALMAKTAGALADVKTARFTEIVAPGIDAGHQARLVAPREGLRADRDGDAQQREADLRIGRGVGVTGLPARSGPGDDVATRTIGEIGCRDRPL